MAVFKDAKGNVAFNKMKANVVEVATSMTAPAFTGASILPTYAVATLPAAASSSGMLVICSDGDAGSPCLALCNGTAWLRIVLGAAVATS